MAYDQDVKSRRVFITKNGNHYQVFSFTQESDGSIYCNMPEFKEIKWMSFTISNGQPELVVTDSLAEDGKMSMHATGMVTYRAHSDKKGHKLIVKGNHLLNLNRSEIGVRHLFTAYVQEPEHIPITSPAFNRKSDYVITTGELKPFPIIFFAVPSKSISVNINASFQVNDLESIPPETGWGCFKLNHHNIVWFIYRTKYMEQWPKRTCVCYFDGSSVPIFIGDNQNHITKEASCRIELRNPVYNFDKKKLSISF